VSAGYFSMIYIKKFDFI